MSHTKTDFYKNIRRYRETVLERINSAHTPKEWVDHWKSELAAVDKTLWVLGDSLN